MQVKGSGEGKLKNEGVLSFISSKGHCQIFISLQYLNITFNFLETLVKWNKLVFDAKNKYF